ncbi:MAG: glycosyltransferase family 4 protein [Planctomycetota bacterium]|nr:glycosyltransferase family 4 protein [Planctomycetota bacterium]
MNIAMFSWEALEGISVGGGAAYASRLAGALAEAGHRVRLFTRMGDGQAMDETLPSGVRVRRCPWDRKRVFFDEIASLAASFFHYFREAAALDGAYDVVHAHEWLTVEAGIRAASDVSASFAAGFHSTEWGRTGIWPDSGDSARIAGLERDAVDRAVAVIAASHQARRMIEQQFHPPDWKLEVVYHGVDVGSFDRIQDSREGIRLKYGIPNNAPAVLFAGRFSRSGGGDLAAAAVGLASAQLPELIGMFVGEGKLENDMRRLAGPAGMFFPTTARAVPSELYLAADLVLAPFRRDTNGRAVLPAWAASKPALTLSGTVPSEFIVDGVNGWIVPDVPRTAAEAVLSALTDRDRLSWMGRNGRVAAETAFSWKDAATRLVNAYTRRERLTPRS